VVILSQKNIPIIHGWFGWFVLECIVYIIICYICLPPFIWLYLHWYLSPLCPQYVYIYNYIYTHIYIYIYIYIYIHIYIHIYYYIYIWVIYIDLSVLPLWASWLGFGESSHGRTISLPRWWFGTFFHILGITIPTDFHINSYFLEGWLNHQPATYPHCWLNPIFVAAEVPTLSHGGPCDNSASGVLAETGALARDLEGIIGLVIDVDRIFTIDVYRCL
jgi:hypothetical protein